MQFLNEKKRKILSTQTIQTYMAICEKVIEPSFAQLYWCDFAQFLKSSRSTHRPDYCLTWVEAVWQSETKELTPISEGKAFPKYGESHYPQKELKCFLAEGKKLKIGEQTDCVMARAVARRERELYLFNYR